MKVIVEQAEERFEPIDLTLRMETKQEAERVFALLHVADLGEWLGVGSGAGEAACCDIKTAHPLVVSAVNARLNELRELARRAL